jgi:hypothetical protein
MKRIFFIISLIVQLLAVFTLHSLVLYLFPFPFGRINVLLIFLMWKMLKTPGSDTVYWFAIVLGFCIELFNAEFFGLTTLALLTSIGATRFLLETVLTNQSWYMVGTVTFAFVALFRLLVIFFTWCSAVVTRASWHGTAGVLEAVALDAAITAGVMMLGYICVQLVSSRRATERYTY